MPTLDMRRFVRHTDIFSFLLMSIWICRSEDASRNISVQLQETNGNRRIRLLTHSYVHAVSTMTLYTFGALFNHCILPHTYRIHSGAKYAVRMAGILSQLSKWKEERLPPPRVSQSEVSQT
jgi:hypothetical protein